MDETQFWQLIDASREAAGGDPEEHAEKLEEAVAALPQAEILAWAGWFSAWEDALELHKLWGACYLYNGGCSDDGFAYFRRWVIGQGRDVCLRARIDPDSLADPLAELEGDDADNESLDVAWTAYEQAAGEELPYDDVVAQSLRLPAVEDWSQSFDFEADADELEERLPRIAALAAEH